MQANHFINLAGATISQTINCQRVCEPPIAPRDGQNVLVHYHITIEINIKSGQTFSIGNLTPIHKAIRSINTIIKTVRKRK